MLDLSIDEKAKHFLPRWLNDAGVAHGETVKIVTYRTFHPDENTASVSRRK